ncbi:MAG: TerC/Alx family metal homeostasis membrane protein [Candidatus Omnitrophica bacterium]|nr:TerC/Alx family metal homeostasis membrane protein [Candidatus Omnitrophota bacterium]
MFIWLWIGFLALILLLLALDLGVFNRKAHAIGIVESLLWTTFWVVLALLFNVGIYFLYEHHSLGAGNFGGHEIGGKAAALQYFTAYLVEKSLSLDNIFVFALIFSYFRIPLKYQHRVLYWGILGALIMRGAMIALGSVLISRFDWIVYVFGGFLIITAIKLLISRHEKFEPEKNLFFRLAHKIFPVTADITGTHFFTRINGVLTATPLFFVLVLVESSDVLFAVDSIPAVFAVTTDPFLVFTSNIFAILGLRSLYFALAGIINRFRFLRLCLVILLAYIGVKMILSHHYPIPTDVSLYIIGGVLITGIIASILAPLPESEQPEFSFTDDLAQAVDVTWRQVRKVVVLIVGSAVILVGVIMLVLPGPAFVVIPMGIAILSIEFRWAKRLFQRIQDYFIMAKEFLSSRLQRRRKPK